jgi:hypothetical protein
MTVIRIAIVASILCVILLVGCTYADVIYPPNYYQLQQNSISNITSSYSEFGGVLPQTMDINYAIEDQLEINNILLEKQNELLSEQLNAQWIAICYAPKPPITSHYVINGMTENEYGMVNYAAWISACYNAGYPTGQ